MLKVPDAVAGKRGKCPKCGAVIDIPVPPSAPVVPSGPPTTERQKEYARSLGIDFPADISKREISKLIAKAAEREDEERFEKLEQLADRESKAYEEMREAILAEIDEEDCRLSRATLEQILDELENRDLGAVLISFPIDEVDFEDLTGAKLDVACSGNLSESEMRSVLLGLGMAVARQVGA